MLWLPIPIRTGLKRVLFFLRRARGARRLSRAIKSGAPLKIVVGGGGVVPAGWIETDIEYLSLLRRADWIRFFRSNTIEAILAEHVWEHLSPDEGLAAARLCHEFLRPSGRLRLAVPDGLHPDKEYREWTRVGGTGMGADDHKVFYTHDSLDRLLTNAGFAVQWLEYFDAFGQFHRTNWDPADGMIYRSARFDDRNQNGHLRYTSLIVDACKPPAA